MSPAQEAQAATVIGGAGDWLSARSAETSTHLGTIGGAVAAPTIADNIGKAIIAGLAGDYVNCVMYGLPALLGIIGSFAAVVISEKPKGPTDEEIHASVARMSRDQLISLLQQPVQPAQSVQPAGAAVHD
jgi:hypothetical protein